MSEPKRVLLAGHHIATLLRDGRRGPRLTYEPDTDRNAATTPLSVSLPRPQQTHRGESVEFFFDALLPDRNSVRRRWGQEFGVDSTDIVALLGAVGQDLPGAVQVLDADSTGPGGTRHDTDDDVEWLTDDDIATLIRNLKTDDTAWHGVGQPGCFSLAGAQRKTALLRRNGRWGRPAGRTPSTHILKPDIGPGFKGYAEVEHFALTLATELGLSAARSTLERIDGEPVVIVERFDRRQVPGQILRLHQEDGCQALGRNPRKRYEKEGGPSAADLADVLWSAGRSPAHDVARFADYLIFQWLIAGTDAHARNYSFLHERTGVTLSPLYDVASVLPFIPDKTESVHLAMKVGGTALADAIGVRHWQTQAEGLDLAPDAVVNRARVLVDALEDAVSRTVARVLQAGVAGEVTQTVAALIADRAGRCRTQLA